MFFRKKKGLFFLLFFVAGAGMVGCNGRAPLSREGTAQVSDVEAGEDGAQMSEGAGEDGEQASDKAPEQDRAQVSDGKAGAEEGQGPASDDLDAEGDMDGMGAAGPGSEASAGSRTGKGPEDGRSSDLDLTVWLGSEVYSMDPVQAIHELEKTLVLHMYEPLLVQDQEGRLLPGQAQSYEVSDDGLTYTFHLRDDLKWSDGSPLTASDFVYAWKRLADYSTASPYAKDLLGKVAGYPEAAENGGRGLGVSAKDRQTFVVTLAERCPGFLQSCTHPALCPVKESSVKAPLDTPIKAAARSSAQDGMGGDGREAAADRDGAAAGEGAGEEDIGMTAADWSFSVDTVFGNGPLKLDAWVEGEYIRLVRSPDYHDQEKVSLHSITFLLTEDEEEAREQLLTGQVQLMLCDAADAALLEDSKRMESSKSAKSSRYDKDDKDDENDKNDQDRGAQEHARIKKVQAPKAGTYYLLFNQRLEPFQDSRVRTALSMVLDRERIADTVMEGDVLPAYSLIGPGISDAGGAEGSSFHQTALDSYARGPSQSGEQAKKASERQAGQIPADDVGGKDTVDAAGVEDIEGTAGVDEQTWETARTLLAQAGYPDGKGLPVIELLTNASGYHIALGQYLQHTWGQLGLQLKIRKITWQYFTPSRHSGDFMIARASWLMDTDDPLPFLEQFTTGHPLNDSLYSDPQVDAAIKAAKTAADRQAYYRSLHRVEQLILEDGAAIPIVHYQDTWVQIEDLDDIYHMPDGTWRFAYASLPSQIYR